VLLAIDTSAGTSVAVVDDGRVVSERTTPDARRHAEEIGAHIAGCLAEAGIDAGALTAVAVGMGPGPFTGLRVGIAAAEAFALGIGAPVLRVAGHDAIAAAHYADGGAGAAVVLTDARRREMHRSRYRGLDADGLPVREEGPEIVPADAPAPDGTVVDAAVSAAALGLLAERMQRLDAPFADRVPLYLRSPDVTPSAGPKRVTA